ncbi:hypothetical protein BU23DRAFT_472563, partial [Bimuria novae-zelandiae CBS 107.79]
LLIFNNYRSYVTIEFINYYNYYRILLIVLPSYLTYTLQPLNIVLFKLLF